MAESSGRFGTVPQIENQQKIKGSSMSKKKGAFIAPPPPRFWNDEKIWDDTILWQD